MNDELDRVDWHIIAILMKNGRASNAQIARQIDSSQATVSRRIQSLIDRGVMEVVAIVEPEEIGLREQALIGLDIEMTKLRDAVKQLTALSPIRYLAYTTGRYDMIAEAYFVSKEELFDFVTEDLPQIDGVLNTETLSILKVAKRSWFYLTDKVIELLPLVADQLPNEAGSDGGE